MLPHNNSRIDYDALEARLQRDMTTRRRAERGAAVPLQARILPPQKLSPRDRLRLWIRQRPLLLRLAMAGLRTVRAFTLRGLPLKERLKMLPLLGRLGRWAALQYHLPDVRDFLLARLQGHDNQFHQQASSLATVHQQLAMMQTAQLEMEQRHFEQSRQQTNHIALLQQQLRTLERQLAEVPRAVMPVGGEPQAAPAATSLSTVLLDSYYVAFEDTFRGSREVIKARQSIYLPYFTGRAAQQPEWTVLDIGCGRGEWLELLTEHGITCRGIDLNHSMAEQCRQRGLQVECGDAIAYLDSVPEGSLGAVTGFHLVEHLPFELLFRLFDAALRALRPDGFVLFETPNPENVVVGSCSFYNDPTHRNPIPPLVLEFLARHRGYSRTEIRRLNPVDSQWHVADNSELGKRFNHLMYGPQDYGLIAWKHYAD